MDGTGVGGFRRPLRLYIENGQHCQPRPRKAPPGEGGAVDAIQSADGRQNLFRRRLAQFAFGPAGIAIDHEVGKIARFLDPVEVGGGGMTSVRDEHGVPEDLEGCHTMVIGGYVIEGHVPAPIIKRLLAERPAIRGISLPGMPTGSPGMSASVRTLCQ